MNEKCLLDGHEHSKASNSVRICGKTGSSAYWCWALAAALVETPAASNTPHHQHSGNTNQTMKGGKFTQATIHRKDPRLVYVPPRSPTLLSLSLNHRAPTKRTIISIFKSNSQAEEPVNCFLSVLNLERTVDISKILRRKKKSLHYHGYKPKESWSSKSSLAV